MPTLPRNRLLALEQKLQASTGSIPKGSSRRSKRRKRNRGLRSTSARQGRTRVKAQSFDYDEPIELTYNDETDAYQAEALDWEAEYDDDDDDDEASALEWDDDDDEVSALGWDDDDDDDDEAYEASALERDDDDDDDDDAHEASAFEWDDNEDNDEEDYEASAFEWDDDAEAFEVEAFEVEDDEDEDAETSSRRGSQSFSKLELDEDDLAEDLDFSDLDADLDAEASSQAFSETDFARDLQAIINGEKTYDKDRGGMVSTDKEDEWATAKSQATTPKASPATEESTNPHDVFSQMSQHMPHNQMGSTPLAQASQAVEPEPTPHDVFDLMGHNMSYANSFDLGSISLEQRFDEFDELLDQEQRSQSKQRTGQNGNGSKTQGASAALALDEAALAADLALMQEAMPTSSDQDEAKQAMQLSTERATVIKPGGATIYKYEKDAHGLGTSVKTGRNSSVVKAPFGKEISVDLGAEITQNNRSYIYANDGGKIGYIRKDNVFPESFTIAQVLHHPRLSKALREQAKSRGVGEEIDFYLAIDNLDADDQVGAIQIYDQYLHDEDYGEKKVQDLNTELQQLNAQVNPNYLLKTNASETWRKPVNVGAARDMIQNNFSQLVHQGLFKKALFLQSLGSSDELATALNTGNFQLNPDLTEIEDAAQESVMYESQKNLSQDLIQMGLVNSLSRPDKLDEIEPWFNI